MQVSIREFCKEVTGADHGTRACRNLLKRWDIPLSVAGNGKGARIHNNVDVSHYTKALRAHLSEAHRAEPTGSIRDRLGAVEAKLDSIINLLQRREKSA